jgi:hypothetical protein
MMNDEQILLKTAKLLENFDISEQKPDKLLRELDEIELEALDSILDDIKGEDIAFNGLFNGEMRKVINFPTMDNSTDLGRFGEFFKKQDFDVDWEKGLLSAVREVNTPNTEDLVNQLMGGPAVPPKTKKIQMKVGKFFAKVADLSSKRDNLYQKVYDHLDKMNYIGANGKIDVPWKVSGKMVKAALDEKEQEDYNRINKQIGLYIPNPGVAGTAGEALTNLVTKMAKYWQTNAGYIKKEINNIDNDKYSIIITRHPIDVLRMSDFEKITSCHSPPSRSGGTNEYYKCAVAEAMGHGALAYVVETEDLLHETNTSNIESAEQEIQDGEIFYDDERPHSTSGVSLEPISRTRLRQMRYYDTDTPKRWDDGTELAVPEERIYGVGIPGIADKVRDWARENQKEALKNMPSTGDDGEDVNLDRFYIFGGSYEDTAHAEGRESLLSKLAMIETEAMTGKIRQNRETEDALDANAISGLLGRYTAEVERIETEWNQRYAAAGVSAEVHGDGDGGVYIEAEARITFTYDLDEFSGLPNSYPTGMHAFDSINDIWGDIFETDSGFVNKFSNTTVHIGCRFNLEHPEIGESALMYDPDGFDAFCAEIDKLDDRRDAFKATIDEFLKREGYMEGGEYIKLAYEIEDSPFESYEWDVRSDGEDPSESYESTASVSHEFSPEELGVSPQVLAQILDSRDWKIAIRSALIAAAQQEISTEYHLDIGNSRVTGSSLTMIEYTIEFRITADDPDERVMLFREVATGEIDDEDELNAIFDRVLAQFINSRQPSHLQQNLDERLVKTWKGFLGR